MKRLLSIVMAVTIVLCSVVQYHHHDREGNIYLNTFLGELEVGFCHDGHGHGHHLHHECRHDHDGGCGETDGCSMHLDQLTTQERHISLAPLGVPLCLAYINYILAVWHIPRLSTELNANSAAPPLPPAVTLPKWLLRGPPLS